MFSWVLGLLKLLQHIRFFRCKIITDPKVSEFPLFLIFYYLHNMLFANSVMCVIVCRNKQSRSVLMVQSSPHLQSGKNTKKILALPM
jgi:hypothetical protein